MGMKEHRANLAKVYAQNPDEGPRDDAISASEWLRILVPLLFLNVYAIVVVVSVELTLRRNNVQGVNRIDSPGQLMPVLIAIGGAVTTFYQMIAGRRQARFKEAMAGITRQKVGSEPDCLRSGHMQSLCRNDYGD